MFTVKSPVRFILLFKVIPRAVMYRACVKAVTESALYRCSLRGFLFKSFASLYIVILFSLSNLFNLIVKISIVKKKY